MPIRVIVVAAHELVVDAFCALLTQLPALAVTSTARSRGEAIARATEARPDVAIVVDVAGGSVGVVGELARVAKVVVVGARDEAEAHGALAAGARGVVGVGQSSEELFAAVAAVARGETSMPSGLDGHSPSSAAAATHPLAVLTPRERQVFERLIQGDSNPIIGRHLGISPKTVDTHRMHVMRKLGVHSVVQLVRFAARHQLLPPDAQSALA